MGLDMNKVYRGRTMREWKAYFEERGEADFWSEFEKDIPTEFLNRPAEPAYGFITADNRVQHEENLLGVAMMFSCLAKEAIVVLMERDPQAAEQLLGKFNETPENPESGDAYLQNWSQFLN